MNTTRQKRPTTPAEREQCDQKRQEKLGRLHGQLADQVAVLVDSDEWQRMLRIAARLHSYSFLNCCAIMAQFPNATRLAGYRAWQSLGYQVRRGEKGITILAPMTYRVRAEDAEASMDAEPDIRRLVGFRLATVFDISQCDGPEPPDVRPVAIDGDAPRGLWDSLAFQVEGEGYTIQRGPCHSPTANGSTDPITRTVTIRDDLAPSMACRTLAHELAHIRLGHVHDVPSYLACRGVAEVEAESVAFIVAAEVGIDSSPYSVRYAAGWAGGNLEVIRATGARVITTARAITDALTPYPVAM